MSTGILEQQHSSRRSSRGKKNIANGKKLGSHRWMQEKSEGAEGVLENYAQLRAAARLSNVTLNTVRTAIESGRLKKYHLGGGAVVVSLLECKKLWGNKTRSAGRPSLKTITH